MSFARDFKREDRVLPTVRRRARLVTIDGWERDFQQATNVTRPENAVSPLVEPIAAPEDYLDSINKTPSWVPVRREDSYGIHNINILKMPSLTPPLARGVGGVNPRVAINNFVAIPYRISRLSQIFKVFVRVALGLGLGVLAACQQLSDRAKEEGIARGTIRLGSVLALEGQEEALGNDMKAGLEAAFRGQSVRGKKIELIFENDYYDPPIARRKTQESIRSGIFLAIGNVGTPTAEQTLPILLENNVPAVGFFTGAELLRSGSRAIVNYRASYAQEIATVVDMALAADVKPIEICAYIQNDSYGIEGLKGLRQALARSGVAAETLRSYDRVLELRSTAEAAEILRSYDRILELRSTAENLSNMEMNGLGPVGVYTRNTPDVTPGYQSLKQWEKKTGTNCRLVVTAGTYSNVARFIKIARDAGEDWVVSSLSFTGAEELQFDLEEYGVTEKVVMTQVVPLLDADFPIIQEARAELAERLGYVSLEGYIVGKMTLKILSDIPGELSRDNFLKQVSVSRFDLGGITIDLTRGRAQASDLVVASVLTPQGFTGLNFNEFAAMFQ